MNDDVHTPNDEILSFHIIRLLKALREVREWITDGRMEWNGPHADHILAKIDAALEPKD